MRGSSSASQQPRLHHQTAGFEGGHQQRSTDAAVQGRARACAGPDAHSSEQNFIPPSQPLTYSKGNDHTAQNQHRTSIEVARYTVGFKTYKTTERVKMRELKIYRNGAWVYCDAFTEAERETHEAWAREFLEAMKLSDIRQKLEESAQKKASEEMPLQAVRQQVWHTLLKLREAGLMTNREAANLCLVRFTWTEEQARARLSELKERYTNRK